MLPQKVREAAERAERIHNEVYGNTAPEATPAPAADAALAAVEPQEPAVPVQDQTPVAPVAPTPAPVAPNWEEKYRVLDGKYKAEVPRMAAEIRDLKASMQMLQDQLAAQPATPAASPIPEGMTPAEVVEQFGEDFAKAVGSIATQIAEQRVTKVREEFKPQIERVEKTAADSQRDAYMRELARLVPDWQQIDTEDNFTAYLDEADEFTGRSRRFFFNEADKHMDAPRVAKFFQAFKGNSTPAPAAPVVPAAPSAIDAMVQPSAVRATQAPQGRRHWTQRDIAQFYADQRRGRYTPADAKRIESDLFAAQREGRIAA
jgi:gas vesicle protein